MFESSLNNPASFLPNYSAIITATTTFKAPTNGWVYFTKNSQSNPKASTLTVQNESGVQVESLTLFNDIYNSTTPFGTGAFLRVIKGYTYSTNYGTCIIHFYPDKE